MSAAGLIPQGVRNVTLTSFAGALRARGFDAADILQALREENRERCAPPLPDLEIRNITKSAAKWKPFCTQRGGEKRIERVIAIPRGCFDPRAAVCGFDPAGIVESDTTLGLWRNHKALYRFLAGLFGPWGCHPALRTIGEALEMPHQHVARHVARLERAALILVGTASYRQVERKFAARSYHFLRHELFAEHFRRRGLSVLNDLGESCHHLGEISTGQKAISLINQGVTEILSHRGDVVPISQRAGALALSQSVAVEALPKRRCTEIPPFDFETAGFFRACVGPDKGRAIHYSSIVQYSECVSGCGGCRIVYSDGTVKRSECSCGNVEAAA